MRPELERPTTTGRRPAGRRIHLRRVLLALTCGLAALALGSVVVAVGAAAPRNRPVGEIPAGLVAVEFASETGTRLSGWRSAGSPRPEFAVVLAHPLGGNRRAMLDRARWFEGRGAAALLFDFRGHGESDATRLSFGPDEAHDLLAAVDLARDFWPDVPVVVDGWSLGAAAALCAGAELDVDGLILEAPYTDLRSAVRARADLCLPFVGGPLAELLLACAPLSIGRPAESVRPIDGASELRVPTLILAGADDRRAPVAGARAIAERLSDARGLVVVAGTAHFDLHGRDGEWEPAVASFLEDVGVGHARSLEVAERAR